MLAPLQLEHNVDQPAISSPLPSTLLSRCEDDRSVCQCGCTAEDNPVKQSMISEPACKDECNEAHIRTRQSSAITAVHQTSATLSALDTPVCRTESHPSAERGALKHECSPQFHRTSTSTAAVDTPVHRTESNAWIDSETRTQECLTQSRRMSNTAAALDAPNGSIGRETLTKKCSSRSRRMSNTNAALDTPVHRTESNGLINRETLTKNCSSRSHRMSNTAAALDAPVHRTQSNAETAKIQEFQTQARRLSVSSDTIPDTHSRINQRCSHGSRCENNFARGHKVRARKTPDTSGMQVLENDAAVHGTHSTEGHRLRGRTVSDVYVANAPRIVNSNSDTMADGSASTRPLQLHQEQRKNTQYKRPDKQHTLPVSSGTAFYTHVMQQNKNVFDNRKQCHCVHGLTDQSNTSSETWTGASANRLCASSKCQTSACHTACITHFHQNRQHISRPGPQ